MELPEDGSVPLCRDPHTGHVAIRLVVVGKKAYPVTNYTCPLCNAGWAKKDNHDVVAIYQQKVFHAFCLRAQLGEPKFAELVASKRIIKEG